MVAINASLKEIMLVGAENTFRIVPSNTFLLDLTAFADADGPIFEQ